MAIISDMLPALRPNMRFRTVVGVCANCQGVVYEGLVILDDAYAAWVGKCPHCKAHNLLDFSKGRGYSSVQMDLVLPTPDEVRRNNWPADWPTAGGEKDA